MFRTIQINRVKQTKYLGVCLDENLKCDQHIEVCSNVSRSISGLRQAQDFACQDVLKIIYSCLIQPVFHHGELSWVT